jgi:predicted amidohydrolase
MVDLAVLPEYAYDLPPVEVLASRYGPAALARKHRCPVVFGARETIADGSNFYNVAAVIDADGKMLGSFAKQRPVPLFRDGIAGKNRPVFPMDRGVLGVAVCYDFDAPAIAATLVGQGATVLVDPTFDAMSWSRIQHVHHELLLRLRAVENDRWILRCASSGRSEAVDPHGYPSANGIEIGKTGSAVVGFAHAAEASYPLGGQLYFLGPVAAAACLVYVLWFWLWRRSGHPVSGAAGHAVPNASASQPPGKTDAPFPESLPHLKARRVPLIDRKDQGVEQWRAIAEWPHPRS